MKIAAVAVATTNLKKTVEFYEILGFKFGEFKENEQHLEPLTAPGDIRLMIDSADLIESLINEKPKAGNLSVFAIEYDSREQIDNIALNLKTKNYKLIKEPYEAFWGQYYCTVADPDGFRVDLFMNL